ncbi:ABC transporter permease [Caviibacterium pharyngocola]|uniref:ABC transporter permease n=1 Tax=Caviibacterium pharyngocola TaxID=28159 RepID=A0A2M8RXT9_9PAST|nr:ABC transporter permease [Caviibacterium pharyngocola]PJG83696.1 ABC transporter permease [Caviibacterium pharyngocola]
MLHILLKRLGQIFLVIWSVGTLTFILTRNLPGDMAYRIAASRYGYDQTDTAAAEFVRSELALDQSWWQSYANWLADLLQFNLGHSLVSGETVWHEISHQFGHTLALAFVALVFALLIGPPLGLLAARKPNGLLDRFTLVGSTFLRSLPAFVIGIGLISLFAVKLKWLPAAGYGNWSYFILPALTLALGLSAVSVRVSRQAMVSVAEAEYYRFSRLKGLGAAMTFVRHGLRNAAIPILAYHSVQLVYLIEGVVIVETLFAWPGSGHALVHAVIARDVPMIQGTALIMGGIFVLLNTLVDLLSGVIDPRIKTARGNE